MYIKCWGVKHMFMYIYFYEDSFISSILQAQYQAKVRKTISILRLTQKNTMLIKKTRYFLLYQHVQVFWFESVEQMFWYRSIWGLISTTEHTNGKLHKSEVLLIASSCLHHNQCVIVIRRTSLLWSVPLWCSVATISPQRTKWICYCSELVH